MKESIKRAVILFPVIFLVACSTLQRPAEEPAAQQEAEPDLPYSEPDAKVAELDSELVFSALAGEIALQRGDLETAYRQLSTAAGLAGDPVAAEKATKVAMLLKRNDLALDSVKLWTELAPNNPIARLRALALLFDEGRFDAAYAQVEALHAINSATGQDPYLPVMAVLSKRADRTQAMRLMRRYQQAHPDDPEAVYALAMLSLVWKDYPQAEADAAALQSGWPDWSTGQVLRSRLRKLQDDSEGAERILRRALASAPNDVALNAALARLMVEMERYEAGLEAFERVHRLEPDMSDVLYSLGVLSLQLERDDEAREYFLKLWEMGSHRHDVAYYLGRIEEQAGKPQQAISWFKKVGRGDYKFQARGRVAQLLANGGKIAEARDWIRNMRIQMPAQAVQFYLLEARILADHDQTEEVFALYREALEAYPDNDDLLYARGLFAAEQGRLELMERDLRSVIDRNPDNADALNALGYTLADRAVRFREAQALISRALELKPDSAAIMDSMGWLHYRMGNLEQAREYLRRAYDLLPDGEIAAHLGEVLWKMGEKAEAEAVWQELLRQDPQNRHILETRKRLVR